MVVLSLAVASEAFCMATVSDSDIAEMPKWARIVKPRSFELCGLQVVSSLWFLHSCESEELRK